MRGKLTAFAFAGAVALGLAATAPASAAGPAGLSSPAVVVDTARSLSEHNAEAVQEVRHRRWHRRHHDRRYSRGPSFHFELNVPQRRYYQPRYYHQPRYVAPRYTAPRYAPRRAYVPAAHVDWCYSRYRSYREWDNTFQPYHGPRRQCLSPYY